ncbi:hypothetical protein Salpa_4895 [Sporomusa sp. KB1]|jgi:hypothetical protein|nr:hypothetical protein Salpa_4895 [Sporomusa sp. KB1]
MDAVVVNPKFLEILALRRWRRMRHKTYKRPITKPRISGAFPVLGFAVLLADLLIRE